MVKSEHLALFKIYHLCSPNKGEMSVAVRLTGQSTGLASHNTILCLKAEPSSRTITGGGMFTGIIFSVVSVTGLPSQCSCCISSKQIDQKVQSKPKVQQRLQLTNLPLNRHANRAFSGGVALTSTGYLGLSHY
jgi:hypothetical protein